VYYYFDSKEDLLYQILEETISTGLSLIQEIEASPKSLKEKLSDILKIHTQAAVDFSKMKLLVHNQDASG
jgi:AcrR family transcriptional regulator